MQTKEALDAKIAYREMVLRLIEHQRMLLDYQERDCKRELEELKQAVDNEAS